MTKDLTTTIRQHVPSVRDAVRALNVMREELTAAKTYEEINKVIRGAKALEVLLHDVDEVKVHAQDTILMASRRIGEEINKIPKQPGPGRGHKTSVRADNSFSGRADVPMPLKSRQRLQTLAAIPAKDIKQASDKLRAGGKDATVRAVVQEITQGNKAERRQVRERELGANIVALPTRRYGVIVADPEWKFEPYSRETGMDRAADNHYPTSELDVIKKRDVPSIAAKDCVLFLWATAPMLPQALEVMAAWGFGYRSHVIWYKDRLGTGYWFRNRHELLLVGTKGQVPAPAPGTQSESVITAAVGKHSEKPDAFLEMIERLYPSLPKIELNRRGPARRGWDAWGNEARTDVA